MKFRAKKNIEVSGSKRLIAAFLLGAFLPALCPVTLFAEEPVSKSAGGVKTVQLPPAEKEEKAEVFIKADTGGTVTLGDASIEIPEGALKEDTTISITRLKKVEDTGESLYNAIPKSGGYRFLPAGTKFEKDVTITLPYNSELNSKLQSLEDLYTYFYDTEKKSWVKLERLEVDKKNLKVRSLTTHFTDMINATLTLPESASPVDVNLNSIKNLEAAKPDGHLIKFNPPKASNMGDASFSFELAIPSGRRGMQPQVSVSYSSAGGNGIMGKGFDVSYNSSITTDTRFGLPKYNTCDTYMLDGILLDEDKNENPRKGTTVYYKAQKEISFSRIIRYGAGTSNDRWEVTDKSGTKRLYEQNKNACVGSGSKTFTWNLTKTIDVHGNTVVYEYEKADNYVYPKAIYYTGNEAAGYKTETGKYSVVFHYDNDGKEPRRDVHIDARSGEITACKKLLTEITTHYDKGDAIRTYSFIYGKEGLAKEKMLTVLRVSNNADSNYEYSFTYTEPEYVNGKIKLFENAVVWNNGSAIKNGRANSGGGSFNTGTGVGVGDIGGVADARLTGGIQGSFSKSTSETESILADIDGDGSPDYVRVKGGTLYYRLNNKSGFNDKEETISIENFKLDAEQSTSLSFGWNIYGGGGLNVPFVPGLGISYSEVTQTTSSYSTVAVNDVDGDKKIDIIISGKDYYLKNTSKDGAVSFQRESYDRHNSLVIENNVKKLDETQIKAYKKQYKTQTPFRQWKAEYEGKIYVSQNVSAAENFKKENSVKVHVYKGKSVSPEYELEGSVSGNEEPASSNAILDVSKGQSLYFITETDEPAGSDINYGIKINYTDIRAYKNHIALPVFFPEEEKSEVFDKGLENDEMLSKLFPKELIGIYDVVINDQDEKETNVTCTLKKGDWEKRANKDVYSVLIKQGRFLPGAFTDEQFDKIIEAIDSRINSDKQKEVYESFSSKIIHDITSRQYIILNNKDKDLFDLLFYELGQSELLSSTWNNYTKLNLTATYENQSLVYDQKADKFETGKKRASDIAGTQVEKGNKIILGEYKGKTLSVLKDDGSVFLDDIKQNDFTAIIKIRYAIKKDAEKNEDEVDESDEIDEVEEELIVTLVHLPDNEQLIYDFSNFNQKGYNLTKDEMQSVVDEFTIEHESLEDEFWNWKEKDEAAVYSELRKYGMDESQQKSFIEQLYDKEIKKIEDDDEDAEQEEKELIVYSRKQNITESELKEAEKIIAEVKFKLITENTFPCYSLAEDGQYYLKDVYKKSIKLTDTQDRKDTEKQLLKICRKLGFGKYCAAQLSVKYDENSLYPLDDNKQIRSHRIAEDGVSIREEKISPGITEWNSEEAWEENPNEEERLLYEDSETQLRVERIEKLYAGSANWFFGIWVDGNIKFSGMTIEKLLFREESDNPGYDKTALKKMSEDEAKSKKGQNQEQPFYLPVYNIEKIIDGKKSEIYPVKKEATSGKDDVEASLIGQISMNSLMEEDVQGNYHMSSQYFFPFVQRNYIHSSRIGGDAFYSIDGIIETGTNASSFIFPNVRISTNEGTDTTYGLNAEISTGDIEIFKSAENLTGSLNIQAGIGGNTGTNTNNGKLSQTVMDVNGDSIPDIIKESGSGINVTPGIKTEKGISYNRSYDIGNVNINTTSSVVDVKGASLSSSGSVKLTTSRNGQVTGVVAVSPTSGSAGSTVANGRSYVNSGLIDINGDGLPDFYDGSSVLLNKGEEFVSSNLISVPNGKMNSSSINSTSVNVNIGNSSTRGESISWNISTGSGVSYSVSSNITESMFLDINGDGLPDKLEKHGDETSVSYNTGNSFKSSEKLLLPSWDIDSEEQFYLVTGKDAGFDLGLFKDQPLIGSIANSIVNALPVCNPYSVKDINNLEYSSTVSMSLGGNLGLNVVMSFKIPIAGISINPSFSGGNGLTGETSINAVNVSFTDLDGDGLADHVLRIPGLRTYWKRNKSGRYGQLVQINMPQGGNVKIDYAESYGTIYNPNFKYVMSIVTVNDGTDGYGPLPKVNYGAHSVTTFYEYKNGYYDRQRKDFLGFKTVTTTNADGTYQIDVYNNQEYYLKGSVESSVSYAKDETKLSESKTDYCGAPYALPEKEESWNYEKNGDGSSIYAATEYFYDYCGNCTKVVQRYGDGVSLTGEIAYDNTKVEKYIIGLPIDITVYANDSEAEVLRHRSGDYDDFGQLVELRQYFGKNNEDYSVNYLTYDERYGNITSVKDSRDAILSYTYDGFVNSFVTQIDQSGSDTRTYTSTIKYFEENIANQTKDSETDCNGNTLHYKYDNWQRIERIWTSYDKEENPAVRYEYHTEGKDSLGNPQLWYAITDNKVTFDQNDTSVIQTVLQIDGLGRAVRTAKTGYVNGEIGWNASGAVVYDNKGRTKEEGMTRFIKGSLETLLNTPPSMTALFTSYVYDEKDRQIETKLPDENRQYTHFEITDGKLITSSKDPLGNISIQEADSRGNVIRVAKLDTQGNQLTEVTYRYNEMGEMLKAFDAKGHPVTAEYDMLGRRTALESLDSGRQEFIYDKCSNLIFETNSELREHNKQIQYIYDGLNRLVRIDYPDTKDTIYTYGEPEDKVVGAAGKILKVEDASGILEYEYGSLGEVKKEKRILATHLNGPRAEEEAVMQYRSDYLGRMQWIIYPDGEQITYGYDDGGQVVSVTGIHNNIPFSYVTNILYDQYGQRTRIDYGNGTYTVYEYDPARRWLDTINTKNKWGQNFQNIKYSFDAVGNVLGYVNDCLDATSGNYKTEQTYSYDNLYQLINVEGETTYNPSHSVMPEFVSKYNQAFNFDSEGLGNMTSKVSKESVSPDISVGDNLNYSLDYVYDSNYSHRLVRAGNRYYKYDTNGNIICEQDGAFDVEVPEVYRKITQEAENVYSTDYGWGLVRDETAGKGAGGTQYRRTYSWNEKNQLISSIDGSYTTSYIYGQDGQRSNKYTTSSETLYFNKMWTLHTDSGNRDKGGQFAKNIYLGDTRIVTKLKGYEETTVHEETFKQYFYHSDHLGSASLISDYEGKEYQRLEYTPYGETWIEKTQNIGSEYLPYKFTAKELDEETGLYYYGARYLDPKYSMWISTDPALGEYIPKAPIDEEAKKYNQNLPGMGGVFNHINSNLYHYAGNNPVRYIDPNGRYSFDGNCALVEELIEEVPKTIPPATSGGAAILLSKLGPFAVLFFVCQLFTSDSATPLLPPGYNKDNYGNIHAPNGSLIATPSQAWKHAEGDPDWAIVEGWGKGTFSDSNESLLYHFDKHGKEVGANNIQQYLNKAKGFKNNLKNAKKTPSKNPLTGEYNATRYEKNGKFIILDNETKDILSFGKVTE